jgi:small neutral amino acid transporter SnatA (MarC family)
MTIASAALLLFLILDPLGNIPVFLSLLRALPPRRQRFVLARELLIALGVLAAFLWGGKYGLELMHLRQESVSIAGGIVLFLIGIRMIFPPPEGLMGEIPDGEPFIVPMAIPLIAGPSGMAAVMLMGSNEPGRLTDWTIALLIAWAATAAILFSATALYRFLGTRVLTALERLMGMLLVAISVQMFLDGLSTYLRCKVQPAAPRRDTARVMALSWAPISMLISC